MQRIKERFFTLPARQAAFLILAGTLVFQLYLVQKNRTSSTAAEIDIRRQYTEYTQKFPLQIDLDHTLVDLKTGAPVHLAAQVAEKNVILTFLSLTCYQCLKDMPEWAPFQQELEPNRAVAFVFVVTGPSRKYVTYMLSRHPDFTLPVLFDSTNVVVEANAIPEVPATLLLDQYHHVVLAGSPVLRPEVRQMYHTHIDRLSRQGDVVSGLGQVQRE